MTVAGHDADTCLGKIAAAATAAVAVVAIVAVNAAVAIAGTAIVAGDAGVEEADDVPHCKRDVSNIVSNC